MKSVFILEHLHPYGEECWERIGIYRSYQDAVNAVTQTQVLPGFCDYTDLMDETNEPTAVL